MCQISNSATLRLLRKSFLRKKIDVDTSSTLDTITHGVLVSARQGWHSTELAHCVLQARPCFRTRHKCAPNCLDLECAAVRMLRYSFDENKFRTTSNSFHDQHLFVVSDVRYYGDSYQAICSQMFGAD